MSDPNPALSLNLSWSWLLGSASFDAARSVAISPSGTIVVAGTSAGDFEAQGSLGEVDTFLVRLTRDGQKLSVVKWGSTGAESASGVGVAADGSIFVTGYTTGRLDNLFNSGGADAFITRFDPSGSRSWSRMWGSFDGDYPLGLALGSAGSVFVAGYTEGNLEGTSHGGDDAFVSRFDASGALAWTRLLGSAHGDYASAVAVYTASQPTPSGGTEQGDRIFIAGGSTGAWSGFQYQGGAGDALLVALDDAGNTLWTRQFGTSGDDLARAVAVGPAGEVYVAGEVGAAIDGLPFAGGISDVFLRKYKAADGTLEWTRLLGSAASDSVSAIAVATDGSIYLSGTTYGSLDGQSNFGGDDVFVAKYFPSGTRDWVLQTGTVANDAGLAIATQGGSLLLAGYSEGNFGSQSNKGMSDAFVANIAVSPTQVERLGKSKYFVLQNTAGNLFDFDLNYPEVSLNNETIELVGSSGVDRAKIRSGVVLDFSFSGSSADKVYLPGNFADYRAAIAGTVLTVARENGTNLETVSVNTSGSVQSSDLLVFANGFVNAVDWAAYLRTPGGAPPLAPEVGETYLAPLPPATAGSPLGSIAKGFAMKEGGSTFAPMKPGVSLFAVGSIGVDKVYVADGTVVDATLLGASADEIYFRGAWADYAKQFASGANTFSLSRSIGGLNEQVTVAAGLVALDDILVFTDGSVSSRQALLALQQDKQVAINDVPGFRSNKSTPGVAVYLLDSPLDDLTNLDPRSNLVLKFSSNITAQSGKSLRIVNDGGSGSNGSGFRGEATDNSMTISVTDQTQVRIVNNTLIVNPVRDLDLANKYHIEIDEGAFKGSNGLASPAVSNMNRVNFETVRPGTGSANPGVPTDLSAPSRRMSDDGLVIAGPSWIDIEALGTSAGSAAVPISLSSGAYVLSFKDYSDRSPNPINGFDGIQVRGFWVSALDFGADDLLYIDNQHSQINDLSLSYFLTGGSAPTRLQFAADSTAPSGSALAGWVDVTLVGSGAGFNNLASWGQLLGLTAGTAPMMSG